MRFLRNHSFVHSHTRGSHVFYTGKVGGVDRQVTVPFHAGASIHPKTMKSIVRQSGMPENTWFQ